MTTETKFTPGPWVRNPAAKNEIIAKGEPLVICRTCEPAYQREQPANANLIASAPELYAGAVAALDWLTKRGLPDDCEMMVCLRTSIAKADGVEAKEAA